MQTESFKKAGCPFCADEIGSIAFMQSANFMAIYNHSPVLPGHSLVIPKDHVESMLALTDEELNEFVQLSMKAVKLLLKVFKTEAFNWTVQEKPAAGQTVSHLHLHLIPRQEKDLPNPGDWYPLLKSYEDHPHIDSNKRNILSAAEMIRIVEKIKSEI